MENTACPHREVQLHKRIHVFMKSACCLCPITSKPEFGLKSSVKSPIKNSTKSRHGYHAGSRADNQTWRS